MSHDQAQTVITTAVENQPKKRGCRRGCLITLGVLALLAVPFVWFNLSTSLRVSKETTYVLGPMTSDGKRIDYFRAMEERFYPPEMKTDDNGYRLIVRACGATITTEKSVQDMKTLEWKTIEINTEPLRLQVYEKLGLDPNEKPTMKKIESPDGVYLLKYDNENPPAEGEQNQLQKYYQATYWTFDDFPMLKDWYEDNTAGIDLLGEAIRKPAFFVPYAREHENVNIFEALSVLETPQMFRVWARAASARAKYRLGIGDIDGAIDDIITIHLIGRHAGKLGTLVSGLVGVAIEGMGYSIGIGSNPEFPPTKEQIERLVRELDALPPRVTLNEIMESERLFGLAAMQDIYWGNAPQYPGGPLPKTLYPVMSLTVDINIALTRLNKVHDSLVIPGATVEGKTIEEVMEQSRSWNPLPFFSKRSRTNRIMDMLISLFIPAMQATREAWRRIECAENMQRLTLALLLYEKEHGKLPDGDWREVVKPYLGENAEQYFRCPSHRVVDAEGKWRELEGTTTYTMVSNIPNPVASPNQILLVEVCQPQKLGEGDGRIPFEKVRVWRPLRTLPPQYPPPSDFDGLGSYHPGIIPVGLRSGAVRSLSATIDPDELRNLLDGSAKSLLYPSPLRIGLF